MRLSVLSSPMWVTLRRWFIEASCKTSYLPSFIRPLDAVWLLLMALLRCIIYVTASDTSILDQNQCSVSPSTASSVPAILCMQRLSFGWTVLVSGCTQLMWLTNVQTAGGQTLIPKCICSFWCLVSEVSNASMINGENCFNYSQS